MTENKPKIEGTAILVHLFVHKHIVRQQSINNFLMQPYFLKNKKVFKKTCLFSQISKVLNCLRSLIDAYKLHIIKHSLINNIRNVL